MSKNKKKQAFNSNKSFSEIELFKLCEPAYQLRSAIDDSALKELVEMDVNSKDVFIVQ